MPVKITQDPANKNVYVKLDSITRDTVRGIRQAYYKIGKDLKAYLSAKILEAPKNGRTYYYSRLRTSKKTGKTSSSRMTHIASAPGEYPANWTGKTRRSIGFDVCGSEKLEFGVETEYAQYLDKSRPFLLRSIEENQAIAIEHFETEIKKALDKQ